jgi:DNA mismatch repair protein MutL
VRFEDPQGIHRLVRQAVRSAIEQRRWVADPAAKTGRSQAEGVGDRTAGGVGSDWVFAQRPGEVPESQAAGAAGISQASDLLSPGAGPPESRLRFGDLRLLGQLLATYLVLESKQGLLLMDQHAAHERVLYERLRAEWLERGVEQQGLLAAAAVQLDPGRLSALAGCSDSLGRLGFDLEPFGDDTVAVRAVPALLAGRDPAPLIGNLADELQAAGAEADPLRAGSGVLEAADQVFASLACHGARRKGEVLSAAEQQALLDAVDAIPWAPTCPHGRPVIVPIELAEIERRFGRR